MLSNRLTELLTAYVDGELTTRERKTVVRLLQKSPEARRLYKKLKGDSMILRNLPKRKLHQDLSSSVLLTLSNKNLQLTRPAPVAEKPPERRPVPGWLKIAAAAVVLLAVGSLSYLFFASLDGNGAITTPGVASPTNPSEQDKKNPGGGGKQVPEKLFSPISVVHDVDPLEMAPKLEPIPKERIQEIYGNLTPKPQPYEMARPQLMYIVPLGDLNQPVPSHELKQELNNDNAFRVDIFCHDTRQAIERLQSALKAQDISIRLDSGAQSAILRNFRYNFGLYTEDLTRKNLKEILTQLGSEDKKRNRPIFEKLVLNSLTSVETARALGGDPGQYLPPPLVQGPLGIDLTRPISEQTGNQILKNLTLPRPKPDQAQPPRPVDRKQALLVIYNPPRTKTSPDVRAFLDKRPIWRENAVQVLIVLWKSS